MEKTIGIRIKECRKKIGMTQEELAKVLHTTVGYLIDGETVDFDAEVMSVAMILQEMPVELRKVAMEQVGVLSKMKL